MFMSPTIKAVILIAGPCKGTRFRPLSLDVPKPLFPLGGVRTLEHHVEALSSVESLKEILILGFYPASDLMEFIEEMKSKYKPNIRYLQEYAPLGTAGGIYHFRDQIQSGQTDSFFVINGDVCADFPFEKMLEFHLKEKSLCTVLATEATRQQSLNYGCIVRNKSKSTMDHFVEKPDTYVSTTVNCGVYIFSLDIFEELQRIFKNNQKNFCNDIDNFENQRESIWLEKDILTPLAGTGKIKVFLTEGWWSQIKSAASAIYANKNYLKLYERTHPDRLVKQSLNIRGNVYIHPTATVHESATIGPNVSIGKNVKILSGARIKDSIILGNSIIGENSFILYSVVGWNSKIGNWCRVEGTPNDPDPNKPCAKIENASLFGDEGKLNPSITVMGRDVLMKSELILLNSIVLPHKQLGRSYKNEIIL